MAIDYLLPGLLEGFQIELAAQHPLNLLDVDARVRGIQAMKQQALLYR